MSCVIAAQAVVVGILAFYRDDTAVRQLSLDEEIETRGRLPRLHLCSTSYREKVLIPVISSVEVVARFGIPEIDLDACSSENFGAPCRGSAIECAYGYFYF